MINGVVCVANILLQKVFANLKLLMCFFYYYFYYYLDSKAKLNNIIDSVGQLAKTKHLLHLKDIDG